MHDIPASVMNKAMRWLALPSLNNNDTSGKAHANSSSAHPPKKRISIKLYISISTEEGENEESPSKGLLIINQIYVIDTRQKQF